MFKDLLVVLACTWDRWLDVNRWILVSSSSSCASEWQRRSQSWETWRCLYQDRGSSCRISRDLIAFRKIPWMICRSWKSWKSLLLCMDLIHYLRRIRFQEQFIYARIHVVYKILLLFQKNYFTLYCVFLDTSLCFVRFVSFLTTS